MLKRDAAVPPRKLKAKRYLNSALLVIDEVGFRPLDRQEANLLLPPSVMSHIKRRIEALELDTCVVRGELPVDLGLDSVSGRLPGGDFGA